MTIYFKLLIKKKKMLFLSHSFRFKFNSEIIFKTASVTPAIIALPTMSQTIFSQSLHLNDLARVHTTGLKFVTYYISEDQRLHNIFLICWVTMSSQQTDKFTSKITINSANCYEDIVRLLKFHYQMLKILHLYTRKGHSDRKRTALF